MKYKITRQQCQNNISGVCPQCGGTLEPIETVDNAGNPTFWCGCLKCCQFSNGIDQKVYTIAKALVEDCHYRHYSHIRVEDGDSEDTKRYKTETQIGGACNIVNDVIRIYKKIHKERFQQSKEE